MALKPLICSIQKPLHKTQWRLRKQVREFNTRLSKKMSFQSNT